MHANAPSRSVATTCRRSSIGMSSASVLDPVPGVVHEDIHAIEAIGQFIDDIPAAGQFRAGLPPRAVRIGARTPGERRSAWPSASGRLHEVVDAQIRIVDAPPVRR
jgi:hypothetical protein